MMTQQLGSNLCQQPRDEYTVDRKYYNVSQGLTEIPTNIPEDAVEVYIGGNAIDTLKANAFSGLSACIILELDDNEISEVEPGAFNGLGNVTRLILRNNWLNSLKVGMFEGLVAVDYLSCFRNRISAIEDNTFVILMRLKYLFLGHNHLLSLSPGAFCGLQSIDVLWLQSNRLTSLPEDAFRHLPRPLKLFVSGNLLQCDADLCWLKYEELNGTITWIDGVYNSPPTCVKAVNWDIWSCNDTGEVSNVQHV